MIDRLKIKLVIFLSSVLVIIIFGMSAMLLHAVTSSFSDNAYTTYTTDTNLLYSYLSGAKIIDMKSIYDFSGDKFYVEILNNDNIVAKTNDFENMTGIKTLSLPSSQPTYWEDYYNAVDNGLFVKRFYTTKYKHVDYWNSYGIFKIGDRLYTTHTIFNNKIVSNYNKKMGLIFLLVSTLTVVALITFSWFFVKRILIPVKDAYDKQDLFIAAASHEFKTPITVINSCLNELDKESTSESEIKHLNIIKNECSKMTDLTNNLLSLADIRNAKSINFTEIQPEEIIIECYNRFETISIQSQISLMVSLPESPLPVITADKEKLIQCLSILLDNAFSYTEKGSISLGVCLENNHICYSVSDTGVGISSEDKEHIFDTFYSKREEHSNHLGLGLSIAKNIATLHNAKLTVSDNSPSGCIFKFIFD